MVRERVTLTDKDVREFVRILEGINQDIQELREQRSSDQTVRLFTSTTDAAIASESTTVTEVTDPTMIWDDPDRGWDYSEWGE